MDLLILKDFMSNVLKAQILKGLQTRFTDLQKVKGLAECAADFTKHYSAQRIASQYFYGLGNSD